MRNMSIAISTAEEIRRAAMLRITVVDLSDSTVVLRLRGRLTGYWVEELRRTCAAHAFAAHNGHPFSDQVQLSLELSEVSFADAAGIALLKELRSGGADLIRPTQSMAEQLKDGPLSDTV
jgi:anti-anti-sigma regulatory factor